jgi:ribonuclease HI
MTDLIVIQDVNPCSTPKVLVGLSQAILYPSGQLAQEEQFDMPDEECVMLSLVGMCLDDDQMLRVASATNAYRHKPYQPPAVTWSQPVIIVPPEEEEGSISAKVRSKRDRNILLHGRVARALGVEDGDRVYFQLDGHKERQGLIASVDDRATFNVVIEANWKKVHNLRPVSLEVTAAEDIDGELNSMATFNLTPVDGLEEGVLFFDGSCVGTCRGLSAGTGFCIYSCTSGTTRIPCKKTKLVSSFRFLGRPFCQNHAEYSALIEGLEWLFRFNFSKVWIIGAQEIISALLDDYHDDDESREIPQIQKANSIAKGMILKASENGLEIHYSRALDDENWEATELADAAIDLARNETTVVWANVKEANDHRDHDLVKFMTSEQDSSEAEEDVRASPLPEDTKSLLQDQAAALYPIPDEGEWSLLDSEMIKDACFVGKTADENQTHDNFGQPTTEEENNSSALSTKKNEKEHPSKLPPEEEKLEEPVSVRGLKHGRGSSQWRRLAKALRSKRMPYSLRKKSHYFQLDAADERSTLIHVDAAEERSTWILEDDEHDEPTERTFNGRDDEEEEEKVDEIFESRLRETLSEETEYYEIPHRKPTTSSSFCYLDPDVLKGFQVVAEDVVRLFRGEHRKTKPAKRTTCSNQQSSWRYKSV